MAPGTSLCTRARIPQHDPGRDRALFTAHSTRVAGVCYLLRGGVPEWVVSILANWSSDQVKRYANRLALDPGIKSRELGGRKPRTGGSKT